MAREIEIDPDKLIKILRLKPTLEDTAALFDCSARAIERHIRKYHDMTFREYRDRQLSHTKHSLIQKAISEAKKGNTAMLIFSLKNMCDWSDKQEISGNIGINSITDLLESADKDILDVTPRPKEIKGKVDVGE